jgi:hypothetical protein
MMHGQQNVVSEYQYVFVTGKVLNGLISWWLCSAFHNKSDDENIYTSNDRRIRTVRACGMYGGGERNIHH